MDVPIRLRRERFEAGGLSVASLKFKVVEVRCGPVDCAKQDYGGRSSTNHCDILTKFVGTSQQIGLSSTDVY